jgi:hypothetical protein
MYGPQCSIFPVVKMSECPDTGGSAVTAAAHASAGRPQSMFVTAGFDPE